MSGLHSCNPRVDITFYIWNWGLLICNPILYLQCVNLLKWILVKVGSTNGWSTAVEGHSSNQEVVWSPPNLLLAIFFYFAYGLIFGSAHKVSFGADTHWELNKCQASVYFLEGLGSKTSSWENIQLFWGPKAKISIKIIKLSCNVPDNLFCISLAFYPFPTFVRRTTFAKFVLGDSKRLHRYNFFRLNFFLHWQICSFAWIRDQHRNFLRCFSKLVIKLYLHVLNLSRWTFEYE